MFPVLALQPRSAVLESGDRNPDGQLVARKKSKAAPPVPPLQFIRLWYADQDDLESAMSCLACLVALFVSVLAFAAGFKT